MKQIVDWKCETCGSSGTTIFDRPNFMLKAIRVDHGLLQGPGVDSHEIRVGKIRQLPRHRVNRTPTPEILDTDCVY